MNDTMSVFLLIVLAVAGALFALFYFLTQRFGTNGPVAGLVFYGIAALVLIVVVNIPSPPPPPIPPDATMGEAIALGAARAIGEGIGKGVVLLFTILAAVPLVPMVLGIVAGNAARRAKEEGPGDDA